VPEDWIGSFALALHSGWIGGAGWNPARRRPCTPLRAAFVRLAGAQNNRCSIAPVRVSPIERFLLMAKFGLATGASQFSEDK